jgi:hypothetical protein
MPLNATIAKLIKIGNQLVSIGGVCYWANSPENRSEGFGVRIILIVLLPK